LVTTRRVADLVISEYAIANATLRQKLPPHPFRSPPLHPRWWPPWQELSGPLPSPDAATIAFATSKGLELYDLKTFAHLRTLDAGENVYSLA
jgi:hypothetical protein